MNGIGLLDYFASLVMVELVRMDKDYINQDVAESAYDLAESMVAERAIRCPEFRAMAAKALSEVGS